MSVFVVTARTVLLGSAWTGTAPGAPGTQTISGTITTTQNISAFISSGGEPGFSSDMVDFTDMASGGFREFLPGLTQGDDLQFPLHADFAASQVWSMLQTVFGTLVISRPGDAERYIDIKPTSSARGSTNPSFVAAVYSKGIQPVSAEVGGKAVSALTLQVSGAFAYLTS
jgi:hypothetical protein